MRKLAKKIKLYIHKGVSGYFKLNRTIWSKAITQMYINNNQVHTRLCLSNFSIFAPEHIDTCEYSVQIYDNSGAIIYDEIHFIERHGSAFLEVQHLIGEKSEYGMVAVKIKTNLIKKIDFIDRFYSHLYAIYHTPVTWDSVGVVHPQTGIVKRYNGSNVSWQSNQMIDTKNLNKIELLMFNPNTISSDSMINLQTENRDSLTFKEVKFKPFETKLLSFDKNFKYSGKVGIKLEGMSAENAKPLIFLHFLNGSFSVSHG
jgi:hypothetical protein